MIKRLFFGLEVSAPWPKEYPGGRLLEESHRHLTVAFLGNVPYDKIEACLPSLPLPSFKVGPAGICDKCLLLPPRFPRVVAWHVDWIDNAHPLLLYQKHLADWLRDQGFHIDERDFLPHITICREPFIVKQWKEAFTPLPCIVTGLNMYESVGNLKYEPRWSYPLKLPFDEIEHTADIAFNIRGENLGHIHKHAQIALAFRFPELLSYLSRLENIKSLDQIVMDLNEVVARADAELGCPFKAVSFHGDIIQEQDGTLQWEMIVDV